MQVSMLYGGLQGLNEQIKIIIDKCVITKMVKFMCCKKCIIHHLKFLLTARFLKTLATQIHTVSKILHIACKGQHLKQWTLNKIHVTSKFVFKWTHNIKCIDIKKTSVEHTMSERIISSSVFSVKPRFVEHKTYTYRSLLLVPKGMKNRVHPDLRFCQVTRHHQHLAKQWGKYHPASHIQPWYASAATSPHASPTACGEVWTHRDGVYHIYLPAPS